jgi:hypothetical protein
MPSQDGHGSQIAWQASTAGTFAPPSQASSHPMTDTLHTHATMQYHAESLSSNSEALQLHLQPQAQPHLELQTPFVLASGNTERM